MSKIKSKNRFEEICDYIILKYGNTIHNIIDAAGGRGNLTIMLNNLGYNTTLVDIKHLRREVECIEKEYIHTMAKDKDLVVSIFPDSALKEVLKSIKYADVLVLPCCNYLNDKKLTYEELYNEICDLLDKTNTKYEKYKFTFNGPKRLSLLIKKNDRFNITKL